VESLGGAARAIEAGFQRRKIGEAAYRAQREIEASRQRVVGVNAYTDEAEGAAQAEFRLDPELEKDQVERLGRFREARDEKAVEGARERLAEAATGEENMLPPLKDALGLGATLGETCDTLREVFGRYRPGA